MASDIATYLAAFENRQQLLAGRGWQVARDQVPTRVVCIAGDVTTNVFKAVAEGGADFQATWPARWLWHWQPGTVGGSCWQSFHGLVGAVKFVQLLSRSL